MSAVIQTAIPVLASLDLAESLEFYTRRLGFARRLQTDGYLIVDREGAEIHFWLCHERHVAENTSCYVRVASADAVYRECLSRGLEVEAPVTRPWGMKELYVIDPHGNLLKFGETL